MADKFHCGEFAVNDNYRLKIYEENVQRPEVCVQHEHENPLCQMLGR